jgi:hypothetical protein
MKKLCTTKLFSIFLIIVLIIFIFYIIYKKSFNIERFQVSTETTTPKPAGWTDNRADKKKEDEEKAENEKLQNVITNIVKSQLDQIKATQGAVIKGPPGPVGPQGPAGTSLIASGKLINKTSSFDNSVANAGSAESSSVNYFNPKYVLTRTGGTDPKFSISYLDNNSAFASFQDWQYDINNNIKSRYDGNCLTMDSNKMNQVLYLDKCDPANNYQKWKWDNISNRFLSMMENSSPNKVKCIVSSTPSGTNTNITNNLNCKGNECTQSKPVQKIAEVWDCDTNIVNDNEIWTFI